MKSFNNELGFFTYAGHDFRSGLNNERIVRFNRELEKIVGKKIFWLVFGECRDGVNEKCRMVSLTLLCIRWEGSLKV